ncbi:uncharacterized protein [Aquarana catesbeiana]|uniref:uncharacterized protein isoform X3 n=1 Tax=Aquarana catesbeiana TaxID=8400 RepID=UPI003CCA2455
MDRGLKTFISLILWIFVKTAYCGLLFKEPLGVNFAQETGKLDQAFIEEHGNIDLKIKIFVPESQTGRTVIVSAIKEKTELYPLLVQVTAVKNETYCASNTCTPGPVLSLWLEAVINGESTYTYSNNITNQQLWLNINLFGVFSVTPISLNGIEETRVVLNFDYNTADGLPRLNFNHDSSEAFVGLHIVTTPCKQTQLTGTPSVNRALGQTVVEEPANVDVKILILVPESQKGIVEIVSASTELSGDYPLLIPVHFVINETTASSGPVLSLWLYGSVNGVKTYTYSVNITSQLLWLNINLFGGTSVTPIFLNAVNKIVFLNFDYNTANGINALEINHNSSAASVNFQTVATVCIETEPPKSTGSPSTSSVDSQTPTTVWVKTEPQKSIGSSSMSASVDSQTPTTVWVKTEPQKSIGSSSMYHGPPKAIILLALLPVLLN